MKKDYCKQIFQILLFLHYLDIDYIEILICISTLRNNVINKDNNWEIGIKTCAVPKVANDFGLVTATLS